MKKLYLFDIDGTLLTGKDSNRFTRVLQELHNIDTAMDRDFRGYTDYLILAALLKDEGWEPEQIEAAMPELLKHLDVVHQNTFRIDTVQLLPGVAELLKALAESGSALGLITGNLEPIAKRKLEALGVWHFFSTGGFGSDAHMTRADLVKVAIDRAGFNNNYESVYVIGDTSKDIQAAHEAGVKHSVGVANGFRSTEELEGAGAELVLEDFTDREAVLRGLGVA